MNVYALELTRIPTTTLKVLQRLAKTLLRDKPQQSNVVIDTAAARLGETVARVDKALITRLVEANPELLASEVDFDRAVDGLWVMLRRMLELRGAYAHRGLGALSPAHAQKGGLEARREEARRANRLWTRLFAAEGTSFTRSRYIVQAESMAALLAMIESEALREELVAVVGEAPVELIEACQAEYEDMVAARLGRKRGVGDNLNALRSDLRWALVAYIQAVHSLYDPGEPESVELVLDALNPVRVLREELARVGSSGDADAEPELEDFVALDTLEEEGPEMGGDVPELEPEPVDEPELEAAS